MAAAVEWLYSGQQDRAVLADLRKLLRDDPEVDAYRYVYRFAPKSRQETDDVALLFSLFGLHPMVGSTSLAGLLRGLQARGGGAERRFRALLDADREDLAQHLQSVMTLVKRTGVGVNYRDLFATIRGWKSPGRSMQKNWARIFWTP